VISADAQYRYTQIYRRGNGKVILGPAGRAVIILSLLLSFPLSALGWYLRKRSQKRSLNAVEEEQLIPEEYSIQQTGNSSCDLILL